MNRFIDIHHHLLFGMDDGAKNEAEAFKMADAAHRQGIRVIFATTHADPGRRPFDAEKYFRHLEKLNEYCRSKGYDLKILSGAEVRYSQAAIRYLDREEVPTMNGTRFVLLEWSTSAESELIYRAVREFSNAGYTVIMAHVERCRNLWMKAKLIEQLKDLFDVRVQIDCEVLLDRNTFWQRRFVRNLLKAQLVDYVATDAHDTKQRAVNMKQAYEYLCEHYGEEYAQELTHDNQLELLDEEE